MTSAFSSRARWSTWLDDSILAGPNKKEIEDTITAMQAELDITTVEGDLTDFLGVKNIDRRDDGTIKLLQPKLRS
jgi:hypothetical protein